MTIVIARETLSILHRLEDLTEACLSEETNEKRAQRRVELENIRGAAAALTSFIRLYRQKSLAAA